MSLKAKRNAKYQRIYDHFHSAILEGALKAGDQLPTEADLCSEFGTSRPTVARALRQLVDEGLLRRRAGSGTFVNEMAKSGEDKVRRLGLLIPGLGMTEIFEPICAQIAAVAEAQGFHLLWGSGHGEADISRADAAVSLCQRYVEQGVEGVFFAPLELDKRSEGINRQIVNALQREGIVVVLLDRDLGPFPRRSDCDLIALDNLRGGYLIAAHLLRQRCTRIDFFAQPHSAQTITQRLEGVRAALYDAGIIMPREWVHWGNPKDPDYVKRELVDAGVNVVVCSNDVTAAMLMTTLAGMGVDIPKDIRICGFDDVKYAGMLRVPLTTIKQPCADIGRIAVLTMMDRFTHRNLPGRKIMLTPQLVVRESCGA
jgi:DNA-binding LacI/PurR family transcriptional regulator